jgi:hypothetical protein
MPHPSARGFDNANSGMYFLGIIAKADELAVQLDTYRSVDTFIECRKKNKTFYVACAQNFGLKPLLLLRKS